MARSWWLRRLTVRCRRPRSTCCWRGRLGVPFIVVFLNKCDAVEDEELIELVEMEVRELLSEVRLSGRRHADHSRQCAGRVERGGAVGGQDRRADGGGGQVHSAAGHVLIDLPFLMPIEDIFSISGRGTVVTGRIERGKIKVGEPCSIVGFRRHAGRRYARAWRCSRSSWMRVLPAIMRGCCCAVSRRKRCGARDGAGEAWLDYAAHRVQGRGVRVVARRRAGGIRRSSTATGRSSTSGPRT